MSLSRILDTFVPHDNDFDLPAHIYLKNKSGIYLECNITQAKSFGANAGNDVVGYKDIDYLDEDNSYALKINDGKIISSETATVLVEQAMFPGLQSHEAFLSYKIPARNKLGKVTGVFGISFPLHNKNILLSIQHARSHVVNIINEYSQSAQKKTKVISMLSAFQSTLHRETR